jgi:cytochrome bd ubiquinol oxidase subunit II
MDAHFLAIFWAGLIAFSIIFYVVLDGYDLGVGMLFGITRNEDFRTGMMNSIAPFWDGNEVWLILIGASLFGAFPVVYGIFLSAFYLPIAVMLLGLIFRGVTFEFIEHARSLRWLWGWGFSIGSLIAGFVQGAAIGRLSQGLPVINEQYVNIGGAFDWLTPFSVLCGLGLVFGYCLLGAGWLVLKKTGPLQEWAFRRLTFFLIGSLLILTLVIAITLSANSQVADRWINNQVLYILPILALLSCIGLFTGIRKKIDWMPFVMSVLFFVASFLALVFSFWPYMIPLSVTVHNAAAPVETLKFLFYGAGIIIFPIILIYTGAVYWVLRGKT